MSRVAWGLHQEESGPFVSRLGDSQGCLNWITCWQFFRHFNHNIGTGHTGQIKLKFKKKKKKGGSAVKDAPANAGDTSLAPVPGRPHMPWSNWGRAPQLWRLRSRAGNWDYWNPLALESPHSATREATAMRSPSTAAGEKPVQQQRPSRAKNK